jgi:putative PIN family toxin of toxin-antitoxin system
MEKRNRIIIDTNLWVSFLLTKQFSFLDDFLENGKIQFIFSQDFLDEFVDVINRPKLRKYFSDENLDLILETIEQYAEFITVNSNINVCRDPKDNFILSLAKDGSADYLITGDQDLLVIKRFEKTEIITIAEFKIRK